MTYTEKELDQFLHGISLSLLSKKSAQYWRYDEETAKEIEWLEALERKVRADKADRKTESSSEKPNNCKDKPTGYNLSPVETEPQTEVDWKQRLCDMYGADRKSFDEAWEKYAADKVEDEPQTEREGE